MKRIVKMLKTTHQSCKFLWKSVLLGRVVERPPIFVVGCGHSGTSLMLAILGSHSRIYPIPFESNLALLQEKKSIEEKVGAFNRWTIITGKARWVEKTPVHVHHIGKLKGMFPGSKFVLMIRDGRDVALSIKKRTGSLVHGVERWVEDNQAGKEFWTDTSVLPVKYERLVADFDNQMNIVMEFLNESFEPPMRNFHKIPRKWYSAKIGKPACAAGENHEQYRNWQINQPLFDGSGKWKDIQPEELKIVESIGGALLRELEYF